jgi:hypothetical protein
MLIHETIAPLARADEAVRQLIYDKSCVIGDEGFSRVICMNKTQVLKLTCCAATIELLNGLKKPEPALRRNPCLPVVHASLGLCALDADGILYEGFVLKRLWPLGAFFARDRSPYWAKFRKARFQELADSITRVQQFELSNPLYGDQPLWQSCVRIAKSLSGYSGQELNVGFEYLERFCNRHKAELDILTKGNILFDENCHAILADPVTSPFIWRPWLARC